uniref:JmjC domain-containing protein n=1 Tax=Chromera velia CCMP2878 TaxID=1169474 RepID=A0A0G4GI58_9ALVE|eukprot:Cvel_22004.t1-p1 / transcript=Cvel_22004.t1 / gene=Cvel_22004 / organism=Chromera_velia_CCMP2878 / gene_product=hypothetical protein / transcript_product=hypothetical protein / location=Cvel_scaffold2121:8609-10762(+) / protein_length=718 / sequence_SO=supercontig / SO=protein_coding / is_pseudo=false
MFLPGFVERCAARGDGWVDAAVFKPPFEKLKKAVDRSVDVELAHSVPHSDDGEGPVSVFYGDDEHRTVASMDFPDLCGRLLAKPQTPERGPSSLRYYLAQSEVYSLSTEEEEGIKVPPLSSLQKFVRLPLLLGSLRDRMHSVNLWISGGGQCMCGVHFDEHDNLLVVLHGTKTVRLCHPETLPLLRGTGEHSVRPSSLFDTSRNHASGSLFYQQCSPTDVFPKSPTVPVKRVEDAERSACGGSAGEEKLPPRTLGKKRKMEIDVGGGGMSHGKTKRVCSEGGRKLEKRAPPDGLGRASDSSLESSPDSLSSVFEVTLREGDALSIPRGVWHQVLSDGPEGCCVAVNFWWTPPAECGLGVSSLKREGEGELAHTPFLASLEGFAVRATPLCQSKARLRACDWMDRRERVRSGALSACETERKAAVESAWRSSWGRLLIFFLRAAPLRRLAVRLLSQDPLGDVAFLLSTDERLVPRGRLFSALRLAAVLERRKKGAAQKEKRGEEERQGSSREKPLTGGEKHRRATSCMNRRSLKRIPHNPSSSPLPTVSARLSTLPPLLAYSMERALETAWEAEVEWEAAEEADVGGSEEQEKEGHGWRRNKKTCRGQLLRMLLPMRLSDLIPLLFSPEDQAAVGAAESERHDDDEETAAFSQMLSEGVAAFRGNSVDEGSAEKSSTSLGRPPAMHLLLESSRLLKERMVKRFERQTCRSVDVKGSSRT